MKLLPILGTIATAPRFKLSSRRSLPEANTRPPTFTPPTAPLVELATFLLIIFVLVFQIPCRLLSDPMPTDGARRDVEFPATTPGGLLNRCIRFSSAALILGSHLVRHLPSTTNASTCAVLVSK